MRKHLKYVLILIFLSYLFFMFGNSLISLTNPDEVFYTMTAKEMVEHHTWVTPYIFGAPQFEKPVFLYWLLRIAFVLFGITSFAARFFPALFGILGILSVYFLAALAFNNEKKAYICALILMSSGLYVGLARTVFTDMVFSIFILFSLTAFFWGYTRKPWKALSIALFYIFSALAVLTKGPLGLVIPFLVAAAFLLIKKDIRYFLCRASLWGILLFLLVSFPWYALMMKKYGMVFTHEFFYNCHIRRIFEAEHLMNDTWCFYPFSMIGCMFPWSIFVAVSLFYLFKNIKKAQTIHLFLACWIVTVFLIFQPAHSKLVSYIFPLFPVLALCCGDFIYDAILTQNRKRLFFTISLLTWFALILIPIGLNISLGKLSNYLTSALPVYIFSGLSLIWLLAMLNFIIKRNSLKVIYLITLFIPIFLSIVPLVRDVIESYASSKSICDYLLKNYAVNNTILTSKFYARGVRYYTDKEIAVIDVPGKDYFSPHPIPFLNTDEKVAGFLRQQRLTYAIVKKSNIEDLERLRQEFKISLLKKIGNEYLLKIEPAGKN